MKAPPKLAGTREVARHPRRTLEAGRMETAPNENLGPRTSNLGFYFAAEGARQTGSEGMTLEPRVRSKRGPPVSAGGFIFARNTNPGSGHGGALRSHRAYFSAVHAA